ncbi:unnamed protein product [Oppiella nova]|uniref:Uncharacterized protein n=1 Tax=Oppiella nova TaxID=334625 RepID=A0A7R9M2W8_9ACAR|nr:unnamed protein product [Oppiella nova]CAG2169724.1 unnamed protein product [Oppiella nova]
MALNKLEADKISLMTIEKELKEKCEDLEQEVDHLKTKFNVLIPVDKKVSQRTGSDNGTGDSGQWSDCDIETNKLNPKQKAVAKDWNKNSYNCDQNMRNEEEFIYVPAIHPPKDFAHYVKQEETRWKQRQRNTSRDVTEEMVSNIKPHVVDVLPKYRFDKTNDKYSESSIGTDRENSELILNWNYSKMDDQTGGQESDKYETHRALSRSMNHIHYMSNSHNEDRNDMRSSNSQHLSHLNGNNNFSLTTHFKPINSSLKQDLSQSNGSLASDLHKKKNIKSSLQSYFFAGHGNCGLYSGSRHKIINETLPRNVCDDHKSSNHSSGAVSALVHKEITEAQRDIGAWL